MKSLIGNAPKIERIKGRKRERERGDVDDDDTMILNWTRAELAALSELTNPTCLKQVPAKAANECVT